MARRCKQCKAVELPPAAKCESIIEKKGYCSVECLADHTKAKRIEAAIKKERAAIRQAKERFKTRQEWIKDAQRWFNKWIRLRDAGQPCISCGNTGGNDKGLGGHNYDAGHYRSVGASPELRFEPDNCFKQCVKCNRDMSGNVVNMRIEILKRIGQERLDFIEGSHKPKKYTIDDLKEIKAKYKSLCYELEKNKT